MFASYLLSAICVVFCLLCVFAAISDIRSLKISNKLNLAIVALFVPAALFAYLIGDFPIALIGGHLLSAAIAFLIGFALFSFRIFGGGDAKMIPAVMLWLGPGAAIPFTFYTALFGGLTAIIVLTVGKFVPAEALPGAIRGPFQADEGKHNVPYGVAIAAAALLCANTSPLFFQLVNQIGLIG